MSRRAAGGKTLGTRAWIVASHEYFGAAAKLLNDSPGYRVSKHQRPVLVLLGFAYELLLKALIVETTGSPRWGHSLSKLFGELSEEQSRLLVEAERLAGKSFQNSLDYDDDDDQDKKHRVKVVNWPAHLLEPRHSIEDGLKILSNWTAQNKMPARYPPAEEALMPGQDFDLDCFFMCNVGWFVCDEWIARDRASLRNTPRLSG